MKKVYAFLALCFAGALLIYGSVDFPPLGYPGQPASVHVSPRYMEKALEETGVPNAVTAILADYRGYDTMFETSVIFTAGVAVMMLLRRPGRGKRR